MFVAPVAVAYLRDHSGLRIYVPADYRPLTLSTPLTACCRMALAWFAITFTSFPSRHGLRMFHMQAENTPLTVNNLSNFVLNVMRGLQNLCSSHPSLFLRQFVKSLESIFQVRPPGQPLEILLWRNMRKRPNTAGTDVLVRPCFISFVEIAKILRISTIIFTIMSVIAAVGGTSMYVSSRLKKFSTRSKRSTSTSWLPLTSLAT